MNDVRVIGELVDIGALKKTPKSESCQIRIQTRNFWKKDSKSIPVFFQLYGNIAAKVQEFGLNEIVIANGYIRSFEGRMILICDSLRRLDDYHINPEDLQKSERFDEIWNQESFNQPNLDWIQTT